jgi:ribosome biogenesis GTPase
MFALPNGGIAIDTPGIREYALWGIPKADLALLMPDIAEFAQDCRFLPCSHTHEPHCAVKQAVEDGEIDPQRYESYILMLESLEEEK